MKTSDIVNAVFELIGAILCWMNFFKLRKDRIIRGVYWPVAAFFSVWGFWNLYYYPSVDCWLSFFAGILLALGNTAWVLLAIFCIRKKKV